MRSAQGDRADCIPGAAALVPRGPRPGRGCSPRRALSGSWWSGRRGRRGGRCRRPRCGPHRCRSRLPQEQRQSIRPTRRKRETRHDCCASARATLRPKIEIAESSVGGKQRSRQLGIAIHKSTGSIVIGGPIITITGIDLRLEGAVISEAYKATLSYAVTHFSQQIADHDRATGFEALGGRLVECPATERKSLVVEVSQE